MKHIILRKQKNTKEVIKDINISDNKQLEIPQTNEPVKTIPKLDLMQILPKAPNKINKTIIKPVYIPIYCLMITGKDDARYNFAKTSIINFNLQDYNNKFLIIVNHGSTPLITSPESNIQEHMVSKDNMTLGDLRNISLSYVPDDAIWTTWDDDDWRHHTYLTSLYNELCVRKVKFIMIRNRIGYNIINKFSWCESIFSGCCCTYFTFKSLNFHYDSKDTNEDGIIKTTIKKNNIPCYLMNNLHILYIRTVHNNNTSRFVKPNKNKLALGQGSLTPMMQQYLNNIITKYYNFI